MDSKAVSPLIGFVLLLAIIMGFIGIVQSRWVPEWNKAVEAKHFDEVSYEVAELSEAVSLAASTGNPAKIVIDAGIKYPNYYVLVSPPKSSGSVYKKALDVNITGIGTYTTYAIVFKPYYFYLSSPELIFEHSAVLKIENSAITIDSDQSSFTKDKITIYLINATFQPFSTTENINLIFYPVSYGGSKMYSGRITFECYDNNTASWWNETLTTIYGSANVSRSGNKVALNTDNIELSINYLVAVATAAGNVEYKAELNPAHLKPLLNNETTYQISTGQVKEFGVLVLDKYWNPVRDQDKLSSVSVSADCGTCEVYSNPNGEVWCSFTAGNSACSGSVTFSLASEKVEYDVDVVKPATSSGGYCVFNAYWLEGSDYIWNVSLEGANKKFNFKVEYGGNDVYNAQVYFALTNKSVVSATSYEAKTDASGIAQINLTALADGFVNVIGAVANCVDIINLTVESAGISNKQPVANFVYSPTYPAAGETVTFDASSSYDPDGNVVSYGWDLDGDGKYDDATGVTATKTFSTWGSYTIGLKVVDNDGLTDTIQKVIYIGDLVYNNDAKAVDGNDGGQKKGGVEFSVTNKFVTTVTIDKITIDPLDNSINVIRDRLADGGSPGTSEIFVDADTDSFADFSEIYWIWEQTLDGIEIPPNGLTVDLGVDGNANSGTDAVVNGDSTAKFYLYEFGYKSGSWFVNVNMKSKDVTITIDYIVGGETKTKVFTITPS